MNPASKNKRFRKKENHELKTENGEKEAEGNVRNAVGFMATRKFKKYIE